MFEEYEKVRIKKNNIIGTIIDKSIRDDVVWYIVESDTKGEVDGAYGDEWPQFDCTEDDIERLPTTDQQVA